MTRLLLAVLFTLLLPAQTEPVVYKPTPDEQRQIRDKTAELGRLLVSLRGKATSGDLLADVEIYHKAAVWIERFPEEFYTAAYAQQAVAVLDRGLARAHELQAGKPSWPSRAGRLSRAYRSAVDGSVQPYGLLIPSSYKGDRPVRLDVVLHGRAATMNEVSFLFSHESNKPLPADQDQLVLEVFGRTNNAYRWAGETDVYEALASVQQRYKVDPHRIVLRGFSMGGAGAWHIGLHDPSRWAAVEAGAGFTETKTYAKQTNLPPAVESALHIYDARDYAENAWNVPFVGYGGEDDPQRQASINVREELTKAGAHFTPDGLNWRTTDLAALFLIGPKTQHKFHPDSKKLSDAFIDQALTREPRSEDHLRFVTYTPRYGRDFWLDVDALERLYQRAEVTAERSKDHRIITIKSSNVARLFLPDPAAGADVTVDGQKFSFSQHVHIAASHLVLERQNNRWTAKDEMLSHVSEPLGKRQDLQGPIDDAFMAPFLVVRPTGPAMNPLLASQARARLERFSNEFAKYMRGDVRIKNDRDVTADDMKQYHVILFGDPSSNTLLARMLPKLPLQWTRENVSIGNSQKFSARDHLPVLICPNPLQPTRYVVLNSGHSFHSVDFRGTNALLFPRLGDWAVLQINAAQPDDVADRPAALGLFDAMWKPAR